MAHLIISVSITVIYLFYVLKMVDVNRDIAMIEWYMSFQQYLTLTGSFLE
mgnify:CR=1 FL=1